MDTRNQLKLKSPQRSVGDKFSLINKLEKDAFESAKSVRKVIGSLNIEFNSGRKQPEFFGKHF